LTSHTQAITHIVQKANGEVVTLSNDQTLKFWDINNFRLLRTQKINQSYQTNIDSQYQNHIYYNNSDLIYLANYLYVVVMNLETGELKKSYNVGSWSDSLLLLSNGNLAVGSRDGLVELPNRDLASLQSNGTLFYWNINDGSHYLIKQAGYSSYNHYCMISLNQNEIAICSQRDILVFEINSDNVKYTIITSLYGRIVKVNQLPNQRLFVYGELGFSVLDLQQRIKLKYWKNDSPPLHWVGSAMFVNSSSVDMVSHGNGLSTHSGLRLWKLY